MGAHRAFGLAFLGGTLALAACGGGGSDGEGGGTPTGTGGTSSSSSSTSSSTSSTSSTSSSTSGTITCTAGSYTNLPTGDCDLLQQDCPDGSWCNVGNSATVCVPFGGGLKDKGADCGADSECAIGLVCIDKKCTPFCCPENHEPCGDGRCDINVSLDANGTFVMVCSYSCACALFMGTCAKDCGGGECHIVDATGGLAVCDEPSATAVPEGGTCKYRNDCGESQLCNSNAPDNGVCRHLCDTATWQNKKPGEGGCLPERNCVAVNAPGFPGLGICQASSS